MEIITVPDIFVNIEHKYANEYMKYHIFELRRIYD